MKKNTLMWLGLGAVGIALFFAYKKRSVPKPTEAELKSDEVSQGDVGKRKDLQSMDMQFAAMSGKNAYIKPQNLIPNVYGNYMNANGDNVLKTRSIYDACKCAAKRKVAPSILANFR